MHEEPEIRELEAQPAAGRRAMIDPAEIGATIDRGFAEIFRQLSELGTPLGPSRSRNGRST